MRLNIGSYDAISRHSFHGMAEVSVVDADGEQLHHLWYVNEHTNNNVVLKCDDGEQIAVLSWTHPGIQLALSARLDKLQNLPRGGIALRSVTPHARARFTEVLPEISGVYEPGGNVNPAREVRSLNLKAVKLGMNAEQVEAFLARMSGLMFVSGAPGSGKTTVALQRIRFLIDQQKMYPRGSVPADFYSISKTRIFLGNANLIPYVRDLLEKELLVPPSIVEHVPNFLANYVQHAWRHKNNARMKTGVNEAPIERRAREAFFALCSVKDLGGCWRTYEDQISQRLGSADRSVWYRMLDKAGSDSKRNARALAEAFRNYGTVITTRRRSDSNPQTSQFRMDRLYRSSRGPYEEARSALPAALTDRLDRMFLGWLFEVYDPLDCLNSYFSNHRREGTLRIRSGTGPSVDAESTVDAVLEELGQRSYRPEELPWIAWLLRFALPEEIDIKERFRQMPYAVMPEPARTDERWTHVVIDEAQDLSAPEASLLASLVDARGAITVSADFRQTVSPIHGIQDTEPVKFGCSIVDRSRDLQFPFNRNMRQTCEIGEFLTSFYSSAFGLPAPFEANQNQRDMKPQLHLLKSEDFPSRIRQIWNVVRRSDAIRTVAVLQVNENERSMQIMRKALQAADVPVGRIWHPFSDGDLLITSSVERVKGLEFDCCVIIDIDNMESAYLNFTKNRVYVALSRAMRRLVMLSEHFPELLRGVDQDTFEVFKSTEITQERQP